MDAVARGILPGAAIEEKSRHLQRRLAALEEVYRIQAARPGPPVKAIRAALKGIAREAGRWVASAFEERPMEVPAAVSGRLAVDRGMTPGALAMPPSGQAVPTTGRTWA